MSVLVFLIARCHSYAPSQNELLIDVNDQHDLILPIPPPREFRALNTLIIRIAVCSCLIGNGAGVLAQPFSQKTFDNVGEIRGGAFFVLQTREQLVNAGLKHCESVGALKSKDRERIEQRWRLRNEELLSLRLIFGKEQIMSSLSTSVGSGLSAVFGAVLSNLSESEQLDACVAFERRVNKGRLDLAAEPQIGVYLKREFLQISAPGRPIDATIAECYLGDRDAEQDSDEDACERAAELGSPFAMFRRGLLLLRFAQANSTPNPKARELLTAAANAGIGDAQRTLGNDYQMAWSGESDPAKAIYWYEKAISQFDKFAPRYLAGAYASGIGVSADPNKALALIALSATWGDEVAEQNLSAAAQQLGLSSGDLAIAKSEAANMKCEYQTSSGLFEGIDLGCNQKER